MAGEMFEMCIEYLPSGDLVRYCYRDRVVKGVKRGIQNRTWKLRLFTNFSAFIALTASGTVT
jgi:hypothetical protein